MEGESEKIYLWKCYLYSVLRSVNTEVRLRDGIFNNAMAEKKEEEKRRKPTKSCEKKIHKHLIQDNGEKGKL